MEHTGLCGAGPERGNVLPGTPMMAYAVHDGRATAVLAGVVTHPGDCAAYHVIARVAVTVNSRPSYNGWYQGVLNVYRGRSV